MRRQLFILPLVVVLAAFGGRERSSGQFPAAAPSAYDGECTSSADLDALPASHWCEVPSSQLNDLAPSPLPYGKPFSSVMYAWSGGWYDTDNDELCVIGGGHDDGAWDGVWCFSAVDFQWRTRKANSVEADIPSSVEQHETFLNGSWSSVHTYGGLAWDEARGVAYRMGGSLWRQGYGGQKIWKYDPSDTSTTDLHTATVFPFVGLVSSVYIPEFDALFTQDADTTLKKYSITADTFTEVSGSYVSGPNYYRSLVWDDNSNILVQMGAGVSNHITFGAGATSATVAPVSTTGCAEIIARNGPGAVYDPASEDIWYYLGSDETRVFSYNTSTQTCTEHAAAPGNLITPTTEWKNPTCPDGCGTYGRWQRVPSRPGIYVYVGQTVGNVVFWRAP